MQDAGLNGSKSENITYEVEAGKVAALIPESAYAMPRKKIEVLNAGSQTHNDVFIIEANHPCYPKGSS